LNAFAVGSKEFESASVTHGLTFFLQMFAFFILGKCSKTTFFILGKCSKTTFFYLRKMQGMK